jgi:cell division protein FtsB
MNVDLGIWDKLRRLVVLLLFVAALLGVIVWYLPLINQNEHVRQAILEKEFQIRQEEARGRQLDSAIRALRNEPRAVERAVREKLGYIKPGETRFQFEPASASRSPQP